MTREQAVRRLRDKGKRVATNPVPSLDGFNNQTYHPPGAEVTRDWCVVRVEMNAEGTVVEREDVVARRETKWAAEQNALTQNMRERTDAIFVVEKRG